MSAQLCEVGNDAKELTVGCRGSGCARGAFPAFEADSHIPRPLPKLQPHVRPLCPAYALYQR